MRPHACLRVSTMIVAAACSGPMLWPWVAWARQPAVRTVLAVFWSTEDFPSSPELDAAIRETLLSRPGVPVDYFAEYLESDRFPPEVASDALRDYIHQKYRTRHIDAVITITDPALEFATRYRPQLFPDAPIVASGVSFGDQKARSALAGVTGMVQRLSFDKTLELALKLHPSTERVYVVAYAPTRSLIERIRPELEAVGRGVQFSFIEDARLERVLQAVRTVPPRSLILYIRHSQEDRGNVLFPTDIAKLVSEASPVPVYGVVDAFIGTGIVGGVVTSPEQIGRRLAEMVQTILAGTRVENVPIEPTTAVPIFDWRQLQRWRIDPTLLPADSVIRFRTPTVWDLYKWYIVSALSVVAVQMLLIAGLLLHRQRRRKAEMALRVTSDRNRELAGRLITAQEEERTRIARELHDDVGQRIASLSIGLSGVRKRIGQTDRELDNDLSSLQRETMSLSKDLRQLSHELHPGTLEHVGLVEALKARGDELNLESGVQVRVDVTDGWSDVPDDVALCLYRVAQEALRNVAKHANARLVSISLARQNGQAVMRITDDGAGFEPGDPAQAHGLGLVSMGERVKMLGGAFEIRAARDAGTVISTALPVGEQP